MSGHASSEAELIVAAKAGDGAAFEQLVRRHGPAMRRIARAIAGNDAAADDAWQEAFLAAHRALAGFRGQTDAELRAWLSSITRNAARRRARNDSHARELPSLLELGVAAGWGRTPEDELGDEIDRAAVWAALDTLEPDVRELVVLRDLEGHTSEQVADALGISVGAMKSRLHRARLQLLAALTKAGGQP